MMSYFIIVLDYFDLQGLMRHQFKTIFNRIGATSELLLCN